MNPLNHINSTERTVKFQVHKGVLFRISVSTADVLQKKWTDELHFATGKGGDAVQIKITTDYAIRCVLYLAITQKCCSAQEIGESMGVPAKYAQHILRQLRMAEIVSSIKGGGGGYVLNKSPENITLLEIIETMESTIRINRCLEDDGFCTRNGVQKHCPVHAFYSRLQTSLTEEMRKTTVWDLLNGPSQPGDGGGEK